jgi:hypothetical protein
MRNKQFLIMVSLLIVLVICIILIDVSARSNGMTGVSNSGCTCHNGNNPSGDVTVSLSGYPTEYDPDTKYTLTITITGGPSPAGANQGGFNLDASSGTLAVPSSASDIQIIGGEATHTTAGNDQRTWDIDWTAPGQGAGDVTFRFAGNSVNGDSTNSGDKWNKGTITISEHVPIDTQDPNVQIVSPIEAQSFPAGTTSVIVSGTASDNIQVSLVEVSIDGSTWKAATGTTEWSATVNVQEGSNTIYARASDPSENNDIDMVNITVQSSPVDDQNPDIIITSPTEQETFTAGTLLVEMKGSASDNIAVILVEVSNDGTIWTPATGTTNWNATVMVQTGPNTLYARARDAAANSKMVMVNITVKTSDIDTEPPIVHITNPSEAEEYPEGTTSIEVEGTASDNNDIEKVEISSDKVTWKTADGTNNWNLSISVNAGNNTIYARAFDTAGNSAIDSVNFTVKIESDNIPPELYIISPSEGETFSFKTKEIEVSGIATDDESVSIVKVSSDGVIFNNAIGQDNWLYTISVEPGVYKITVTAEDQSGNVAKKYVNFTVLADDEPPTLDIKNHFSGEKLSAGTEKITLTGSASDNDEVVTVEVSTDNSTWQTADGTESWSISIELTPGKNIIYIRVTDANNNINYRQIELTVIEEEPESDPTFLIILVVVVIVVILILIVLFLRTRKRYE